MHSTDSPSSFYQDELLRALTEQSFGIRMFYTLTTTRLQATASVTLLEGQRINIKLEMRGYSVRVASVVTKILLISLHQIESGDPALPSNEGMIFESLDELLRSASPMYEQKRHEFWVQKLEGLV
jgi:hypothetical protein